MEEMKMKNMNKGIMVTTTIAAAAAAMTLAGCGKTAESIAPVAASANVAAAVKTVAEDQIKDKAEEKTVETKPEAAKEEKKETKKDTAKKDTKKSKKSKKSGKTDDKKAAAKTIPNAARPDPKDPTPAPAAAQKTAETKKTETAKKTEKKAEPVKAAAKTVDFDKFTAVWEDTDMYAGTYYQTEGTGVMEVKNIGNNNYAVRISTAAFKDQLNVWEFVGEFDGRAAMNYTDCRMTVRTIGSDEVSVVYTNGRGYIKFTDEIVWNDYEGYGIPDTVFSLDLPTAAGGGSDKEVKAEKVEQKKASKEYAKPVVIEEDTDPEIELDDEIDAGAEIESGNYYDGNGSGATMNVRSAGAGVYECTVKVPDTDGDCYEYTFTAELEDSEAVYFDGEQELVYMNGDRGFVSDGHSGTLRNSNTGLVWTDNDGSSFVFVM